MNEAFNPELLSMNMEPSTLYIRKKEGRYFLLLILILLNFDIFGIFFKVGENTFKQSVTKYGEIPFVVHILSLAFFFLALNMSG